MSDKSLEELLTDEIKIVFKFLLKMGVSIEDAEDIAQETLYKALKYIDSIDSDRVRAWLFKVAINDYYTIYGRKKRRQEIDIDNLDVIGMFTKSAEDIFLTNEKGREIKSTLAMLQPEYRDLLVLKYTMNFSYRDIADVYGYSEDKVKVYLYRARNRFKQLWEARWLNERQEGK